MNRKPGYILEQAREHRLCRASIYWRMSEKGESADEAIDHLIKRRSKPSIAQRCRDAGVEPSTVRDRRRLKGMTVEEAIEDAKKVKIPVTVIDGRGHAHHFKSLTAACHFAALARSSVVYQMENKERTLQEAIEYLYQRRGEEWY